MPILFDSDIEMDQANPGTVGKAWVEWSLSESPDIGLYDPVASATTGVAFSATAAGTEDGTITFTLPRTAVSPDIDTYVFTLSVQMLYQNSGAAAAVLLYEKSYTITVQRQGTGVTDHSLSTGDGGTTTEDFTATAGSKMSPLVSIASPATGLSVTPNGGPFASPAPIVLTAQSSEEFYKVWFSDTASVKVYTDLALSNLVYEWPSSLAASSTTIEDTADVTVTLNSVPEALYDLGTIYVGLNVNFRDTEGDRRALRAVRGLEGEGEGAGEEQKASVIAEVEMLSSNGSGSVQVKILSISSVVAGAAAALLA